MPDPNRKAAIERETQAIYRRLMKLRDELQPGLSGNDWTRQAGVSTSYFTNMQGVSKPASEPGVVRLREVLGVLGLSLSEFFLDEAQGRVVRAPDEQALEQAFRDALAGVKLPANPDARASFLASTVRQILGLPAPRPARKSKRQSAPGEPPAKAAPATTAPARRATRQA